MLSRCVFTVCLLALCPATFADTLDINMNNTAAQFRLGSTASAIPEGNAEIQRGLLFNDQGNLFAEAGLAVKGPGSGSGGGAEQTKGEAEYVSDAGTPGLSAGGGIKGVFGVTHGVKTNFVSCIAIGADITFSLPTAVPVAFAVEYYSTFKILTFLDADRFNQFGLRMEASVSPQAKIYWAYREIGFGLKNIGGTMLEKGSYVGITIPIN